MQTKTAVIYARVSDRNQLEADISIPSQIEECHKKADALGATVVREFVDKARTGRHASRRAFQDAITFCELNSPTFFITWSTSRFARNRWDAALYKKRLAEVGTEMAYITLAVDRTNPNGRALEAFFEIIDELQSDQIAADTRRSMMMNARGGFRNGGRPPFGFDLVRDDGNHKRKRLVANESEADIVRRIVSLRIEGHGAKTIAEMLRTDGQTNRGRRWTKGSIGDLLRNEALIGNTVFGKKDRVTGRRRDRSDWIIVRSHEPIITLEQWDAVQLLMNEATANTASGSPLSRFLFTGILKCGTCGESLQTESAKGRSRRYHYYNCRGASRHNACPPRRIPAHEFDEWLASLIVSRIFSEENLLAVVSELENEVRNWSRERDRRRSEVLRELQAEQRKNSKLYEVLELYGKDAPNLGDLTRRLRANNQEIARLEKSVAEIDAEVKPEILLSSDDIADLPAFLSEIITSAKNVSKVRSFLASFIHRISVHDADVTIDYKPDCLLRIRRERAVPSVDGWLPEQGLLGTVRVVGELPRRFWRRAA